MQVSVTFRHMEASQPLKDYASEKIEKLRRYIHKPLDASIVLGTEARLHVADITLNADGVVMRGKEKTDDMYLSIDGAMDKIERQVRRYKKKLRSKNFSGREEIPLRYDVIKVAQPVEEEEEEETEEAQAAISEQPAVDEADLSEPPRLVRSKNITARAMTVNEAIMQMDLLNNNFLVFTNADSREVSVIYRRKDGDYGLIEARRP